MSDDPLASFIKLIAESGLLPAEWTEQRLLDLQPAPANLNDLLDVLQKDGVITPYQHEQLQAGRLAQLTTADYNVVDAATDQGDGAYKAIEKSSGNVVLLRRWTAEQLAPVDTIGGFAARVTSAQQVQHDHLKPIRGMNVDSDSVAVASAWPDGSDLKTLVADMGPMPILLAIDYIRQAADAMTAAHEAGVIHGDLRPTCLKIAPLVLASKPRPDGTPRYRPSATAKISVAELGEVPERTRAADWPPEWADKKDYLAPERLIHSDKTSEGDVYSLAACLYYLLTAHRTTFGPLAQARPDTPEKVLNLFLAATASDPKQRPTVSEFAQQLAHCVRHPDELASPPVPPSAEVPIGVVEQPVPDLSDLNHPVQQAAEGWQQYEASPVAVEPEVWTPEAAPTSTKLTPRTPRQTKTTFSRKQIWILAGAFVGLNLIALILWVLIVVKPFAPKAPDNRSAR
jgi:eukaryotic-like serine/threonine-protein kinase